MMNKNKFVFGAAAAMTLAACGGERAPERDSLAEYEYSRACGQYASWGLEAQETRRSVELAGGNPNGDFLYQNQHDAAQRAWTEVTTLERQNPELKESGLCEKAIVHYLYTSDRL